MKYAPPGRRTEVVYPSESDAAGAANHATNSVGWLVVTLLSSSKPDSKTVVGGEGRIKVIIKLIYLLAWMSFSHFPFPVCRAIAIIAPSVRFAVFTVHYYDEY